MIAAIFQLLLAIVAGGVLFQVWRHYVAPARFGFIVTAGFLIRAFAGMALFWVSWLELPFARSLQTGNGLWFFALDASLYVPNAFSVADRGLVAIALQPRNIASVTFVQVLAVFAYIFGKVVSVALLANLFAFLGSSIIIIRWSSDADRDGNRMIAAARAVALAAISLSPSAILWSLQPLKDIVFQFLVVAFLGAALVWQHAWRRSQVSGSAIAAAVVMLVALYGIAGIRWYVALVLIGASFVFAFVVAFAARGRRLVAAGAALLLLFGLTQALRYGAGPYIPERLTGVLRPTSFVREVRSAPDALRAYVEHTRRGFERVGGATTIRVGRKTAAPLAPVQVARHDPGASAAGTLAAPPSSPPTKPPAAKPPRAAIAAGQSRSSAVSPAVEPTVLPPVSGTAHEPARLATVPTTAEVKPHVGAPPATTSAPLPVVHTTPVAPPREPPPVAPVVAATPAVAVPTTSAARTDTIASATTPSASQAPAPVTSTARRQTARSKVSSRKSRESQPAPVQTPTPAQPVTTAPIPVPPPVVAVAAKPAAVPTRPEGVASQDFVMPTSRVGRIGAGAAAMLVPQTVARKLGLIEVGGGRGLMWFTDLDTLVFDAVLLTTVFIVIRRLRRAALSNGVFWLLTLATLMIALPLVYTVTNFGTLFRLRAMVYTGLALLPLSLLCSLHDKQEAPEHTAAS